MIFLLYFFILNCNPAILIISDRMDFDVDCGDVVGNLSYDDYFGDYLKHCMGADGC